MKILVVEDDQNTQDFIAKGLRENGHTVTTASDGQEGLFLALEEEFDLLVLDRMLPKMDGLTLLGTLRKTQNQVPVIMLTALGLIEQKVEGLTAGADDYLTKPFAFSELLARIQAISRRGNSEVSTTSIKIADLEIDLLAHTVIRAGQTIDLQSREFRLLKFLAEHCNQVVTRTMLLENVWDYHFDPQTNVIDVHVSRLRGKIDKHFDPPLIHTIRGSGYMLRGDASLG